MPEYRRIFQPGGTFFFTVVTYHRTPLFLSADARCLLAEAFRIVQTRYPFQVDAFCLLPDHLHCIWILPENEENYPLRWGFIKSYFTHRYQENGWHPTTVNHSREKRREGYTWQRRYWAHLIVDEADYERHIDYLHFNPVKHGLVENVEEWEWSSFNRYKNLGWYAKGLKDPSIGQIRLMEQWE